MRRMGLPFTFEMPIELYMEVLRLMAKIVTEEDPVVVTKNSKFKFESGTIIEE